MGETSFFSLQGPLDALPAGRQMRAANFEGFLNYVHKLGGNPRWILEQNGVDPAVIRDADCYIDAKSLADVFEYCSTYFNDSLFGLHLAQVQDADVFGAVSAVCRTAPTFREAINSFIDYIPVIHAANQILELVEGERTAEVRYCSRTDTVLDACAQANFEGMLLIVKLFKQIGGKGFRPSYVSLAAPARRRDIAEFEDIFGCPFHSNAPNNAIAFPIGVLDQPVANSSRQLYSLLSSYLDRLRGASKITMVSRVEDYVRGSLSSGHCSIERCAQKLGISARTLQVHLKDRGVRFSEILEEQRIELAKSYLKQADVSLDEIAFRLGYAEQSSFGRAFKRWTTLTPQAFRETRRLAA